MVVTPLLAVMKKYCNKPFIVMIITRNHSLTEEHSLINSKENYKMSPLSLLQPKGKTKRFVAISSMVAICPLENGLKRCVFAILPTISGMLYFHQNNAKEWKTYRLMKFLRRVINIDVCNLVLSECL